MLRSLDVCWKTSVDGLRGSNRVPVQKIDGSFIYMEWLGIYRSWMNPAIRAEVPDRDEIVQKGG
jgi:hypothetical protein